MVNRPTLVPGPEEVNIPLVTIFGLLFLAVCSGCILYVSREHAPLPFLVGACYMTFGQAVEIGPFTFTFLRLLILTGFLRLFIRRETPGLPLTGLDHLAICWSGWTIASAFFYDDIGAALSFRLGEVYNRFGIYLLFRTYIRTPDDVLRLVRATAICLLPLAIEMALELVTRYNLFSVFGGVSEGVYIRDGKPRAQGPFLHPILAGSVGAVCAPLFLSLRGSFHQTYRVGIVASLLMVLASNSSGPVLSLFLALCATVMWNFRKHIRLIKLLLLPGYLILEILMSDPAYFLIARLNITGSSTGWHRVELIRSSLAHLDEWWLAGTNYTRHWMATGVSWSPDHTDITNFFIKAGVLSGLPAVALLISQFLIGLKYAGLLSTQQDTPFQNRLVWSLGCMLFSFAATGISVSFFDQSFLFLYINLAALSSLKAEQAPRVP